METWLTLAPAPHLWLYPAGCYAQGVPAVTPKKKKAKLSVEPAAASFPWERQPGESLQAYARFVAYRNTPSATRSMRKVGVAKSLAFRWARNHRWVARCDEYEAWLASLADGTSTAASLLHRAKAARFADRALDKATLAVESLNPAKLSSGAALELALGATGVARLALAIPDAPRPGLAASGVSVGVGVVWGGEHPPWLAKPNASGTDEDQPNEARIERKLNGRVKVLAKELGAAGGVHAPSDLPIEIAVARGLTIKEKD